MGPNNDCRSVGQFGGRLESDNDRVLSPWMGEFSDGDISLRLVGNLFRQLCPLPRTASHTSSMVWYKKC